MLPSCTTKRYLQMFSTIFLILIYRLTNQYFNSIKKTIHLIFMLLKKINNRLVTSRKVTQRLIPKWIRHRPTIKNKSSSIASFIFWQAP